MQELIFKCDWKGGDGDQRVQFSAGEDPSFVGPGNVADITLTPEVAAQFTPGKSYRVTFEEIEA